MSIIDQKELDKLLNITADEDVSNEEPENKSEESNNSNNKAKVKIFKKTIDRVRKFSFTFTYVSPVIKQENMIYNPESSEETDDDKIVVRNLDNYMKSLLSG